jgi:membrane protein involved in colicin uptake
LEFLRQLAVTTEEGVKIDVKTTAQQEKLQIQLKRVNDELKNRNKLEKEKNATSETSGKLEEIDIALKEARAKQLKASTEVEIKAQQVKIKALEKERQLLLDIGEMTDKAAADKKKREEEEYKRQIKLAEEEAARRIAQLDKEIAANKKAEEEKRKFQDETIAKAFEAGEKLLAKQNDLRMKDIESRISASENAQNRLQASADSGNKDAAKSLALEAKNQRDLEAERERTIKRQTAQAIILTGLELTIAAARRGEENPAQTAAGELSESVSQSISTANEVSNLAGFFTGTEKVSSDLAESKFYDGKDGYAIRVDGKERILQGSDNDKLAGLTNAEVTAAGVMYKKGDFEAYKYANPVNSVNQINVNDNSNVVAELKDLKSTFINSQKTIEFSVDPINNYLVKETKFQNKVTRQHKKNGRLF